MNPIQGLKQAQVCPNPIFIIGSPRSGSTILAASLHQHSQLWTSGESDILADLFGKGRVDAVFKRGTRDAGNWLRAQGVARAEFLGYLGLGLNALFTSRSHGKRWVDQTPAYALMADVLAVLFPGAFFLHVIRDGRKVVHSMVNFAKNSTDQERAEMVRQGTLAPWAADFTVACREWAKYVEISMNFCARHPARSLTVVNEKLVADPHQEMGEIFRFIGAPFEEAPVDFFRTNRINSSFGNTRGITIEQSPDPWEVWTGDQKQIFLKEAGLTLATYGPAIADWLELPV